MVNGQYYKFVFKTSLTKRSLYLVIDKASTDIRNI